MRWEVVIRRAIPWEELERLQKELAKKVSRGPFLLLSEPLPTLTAGRNAPPGDLLLSPARLQERGIATARVSRGGKWTYHGPGQVLLYPILSLTQLGFHRHQVRGFLERFREGIGQFVEGFGLKVQRQDCPYGLYTSGAKLVSFGIAIERGVTQHGAALYLAPQQEGFGAIHPCGVLGEKITSLEEQGITVSWEVGAYRLARSVEKAFNCG